MPNATFEAQFIICVLWHCLYCLFLYSGVREEADGSVTYCLMGNGLTIMADEEYLTISSTLEHPHSLPSSLATHNPTTSLTALPSQTSSILGSQMPTTSTSPHGPLSDTPTTCSLAHPTQPLTTQPPKAKHHTIQQGLYPSHHKFSSKNGRTMVPPSQPSPPTLIPITAQVVSSLPPCTMALPLTARPMSAQSHAHLSEDREKKDTQSKEYDEEDDDEDEEEEERRRKVSS